MLSKNILVIGIEQVQNSITTFKVRVREFYFEVLLSGSPCPSCTGKLVMVGISQAKCETCRNIIDPTEMFQRSPCCGELLILRRAHYACSACGTVVPSRFLFDERVFDSEYFRQAMRESRERAHERRERVRLMLLGTRSDSLVLTELPGLDSVPGFVDALSEFLGAFGNEQRCETFGVDPFRMEAYREAILRSLLGHAIQFDAIPPLHQDARLDRVRRFITLVFMEHERELKLTQYGNQILVGAYEADIEG